MGHLYSDGADRPVWDFGGHFLWGNRLEYGDQLPSDCLYHLFLKTDYEQETADAGTKESGKLPEGNGEKIIEWTLCEHSTVMNQMPPSAPLVFLRVHYYSLPHFRRSLNREKYGTTSSPFSAPA